MSRLSIKRIYENPADADGFRILVDRIWPRGVSKERAAIDLWLKEVAPSPALRTWFAHDPDRWMEFRARYARELDGNEAVERIRKRLAEGPVTLLYSARDREHNQAVALAAYLAERE